MKKKIKGIVSVLVILFALVGAGGLSAYASGNLTWNVQDNYEIAMGDLENIIGILQDKNDKIGGLETAKGNSEARVTELETANELLTTRAEEAEILNSTYETSIANATNALNQFSTDVENTDGTRHKLDLAIALIDELSTQFGTNADLTDLRETLDSADTDLETADGLMESVKEKTQTIIEEYSEETVPPTE